MSSNKHGPPKHQNQFAWKPNLGIKINETEVGGRFRPLSEITGVCPRCKDQIDWKRRYGKYKALTEPAKCQHCSKRAVRQAYHSLCTACAKEQKVCAKCRCCVNQIVGRDLAEVEAEKRALEEAIKNARERDRRALLRAMNKGKTKSSEQTSTSEGNKVGDLFPTTSLEDYAAKGNGGSETSTSEGNKVGDLFPTTSLEDYAAKGNGGSVLNVNGHKDPDHAEDEEDTDDEEEGDEVEDEDVNGEDEVSDDEKDEHRL